MGNDHGCPTQYSALAAGGNPMRIAVFGMGYVGLTTACCMASEGHSVVGVDKLAGKLRDIGRGIAPFKEPGLQELLTEVHGKGLLAATESVSAALDGAILAIVCVGTPSTSDGALDMRSVIEVTQQIASALAEQPGPLLTVAYRSTMQPGSMTDVISPIFSDVLGADWEERVELVYNPEFLREASAIADYFHPPKIIVGTRNAAPSAAMGELYRDITAPVFHLRFEPAEITKFIDNSWHAVKVAFANEVGRICEGLGISARQMHEVFVADTKLNISSYYTRPGGPFGGSCLPKDVRALCTMSRTLNANAHLLDSVLRSNEAHKRHQLGEVRKRLPMNAKVLMVGLAFKDGTDDLRECPNVELLEGLLSDGHFVQVYDPFCKSHLHQEGASAPSAARVLLEGRLIASEEAETGDWDLVIVNSAAERGLKLGRFTVYKTHTID